MWKYDVPNNWKSAISAQIEEERGPSKFNFCSIREIDYLDEANRCWVQLAVELSVPRHLHSGVVLGGDRLYVRKEVFYIMNQALGAWYFERPSPNDP